MKKFWMILVNVLLMLGMLSFVVVYATLESQDVTRRQIEHFENTTITMEHVTENYLEGEQRICDVWAHYINSENLTIEQATDFVRISHVLPNASAHIVYTDTLTGLSTRARLDDPNNYYVSYERLGLLNDPSWIEAIGTSINVSRAYTNPVNGEQSIAFCNFIKLQDASTGQPKDAILLRVLPADELTATWVFPQEEFQAAELSIIDENGDYIIKGHSFKNSSFFEFYRSYNTLDPSSANDFFKQITSTTGSFFMQNSHHEECIVAYTPFDAAGGWTLLNMMPTQNLNVSTENWLLIGVVSAGLLLLLIIDGAFMWAFNKKLREVAKEAESANKAKTVFLSTMSHDIRTPMNAIIGLTTIAEKNLDDKKSVKESLRKVSLASNHLLTLINDILDISKVESGKLSLIPQTFSIVDRENKTLHINRLNGCLYVIEGERRGACIGEFQEEDQVVHIVDIDFKPSGIVGLKKGVIDHFVIPDDV